MPKGPVTDPITDQEIAFARLVLSGTMNDREAAGASGINPNTAAYTKAKPRVREYMDEHRAAVNQQLIDHEVEDLRKLQIGREQMLARLWELANLSPEATKNSIAGQIRALNMIAVIQGFLPDRRSSSTAAKPAAPLAKPQIYISEAMRRPDQTQAQASVTSPEAQPTPPPPGTPQSAAERQSQTGPGAPFTYPKDVNWVPNAIGPGLDTYSTPTRP